MAGKGPPPAVDRRRRNVPAFGDWKPAPGIGWQHGRIPAAPPGLMAASKTAWRVWFTAWFASHWTPDDLPGIRQVVRLYDQVERGEYQRSTEMRIQMDAYGMTPNGQQLRRWARPLAEAPAAEATKKPGASPYATLRVVSE